MSALPFLFTAAFAGAAYLPLERRQETLPLGRFVRPLAPCILALFFFLNGQPLLGFAFACSGVGDYFFGGRETDQTFATGACFFLLSYIIFTVAFGGVLLFEDGRGSIDGDVWALFLGAIGISVYIVLWPGSSPLIRIVTAVYILVSVMMIWMSNKVMWVLFLGALLHAVGDIVVGFDRFSLKRPWMSYAGWTTYVTALLCFAYGFSVTL